MRDEFLVGAKAALRAPKLSVTEALASVPDLPGLYALHGDSEARQRLILPPCSGQSSPLYVGKAERSLSSRDVRTHFATGKTGSSTLRRSCAALLVDVLDLAAVPRNQARPDGSANFGLDPAGDQRLTEWMQTHLALCVWVSPAGVVLDEIETLVIRDWQPPLNLEKVVPGSRKALKAARAGMAAQARAWVEP